VLSSSQAIIVTRLSEPGEAQALHALRGQGYEPDDWYARLRTLERGYAALLPGVDESGDEIVPFRVSARLTAHVRHLQKYLNRRVPAGRSFMFRCSGTADGCEAFSLGELLTVLSMAPELGDHLRRGDLSRWIRDVFDDRVLANRVRALETRWKAGRLDQPHVALITTIRERYGAD
jgi:hypothetical protein